MEERIMNELISKFNQLTTVKEKISFWYRELNLNYIDLYRYDLVRDFGDVKPFHFDIPRDERIDFSVWILENYLTLSEAEDKEDRLLSFDKLQADFLKNFEQTESEDRKDYTFKELKRIEQSYSKLPVGISGKQFDGIHNYTYDASHSTYLDYLQYRQTPNYKEIGFDVSAVLHAENGVTLAKYVIFLKDQLHKLDSKQETLDEPNKTQVLLLLHQTGVIDFLEEKYVVKAKVARFLNLITGNNTDNIEKFLTARNLPKHRSKTKENYEFLSTTLDKIGFKDDALKARAIYEQLYKESLTKNRGIPPF